MIEKPDLQQLHVSYLYQTWAGCPTKEISAGGVLVSAIVQHSWKSSSRLPRKLVDDVVDEKGVMRHRTLIFIVLTHSSQCC